MSSLVYVYGSGECEQLGKFFAFLRHLQALNSKKTTSGRSSEPRNYPFSTRYQTHPFPRYWSVSSQLGACTQWQSLRLAWLTRGDAMTRVPSAERERKTNPS